MGISKIDDKNRIVIPKHAVNYLNVEPGDLISVEIENNRICLFKAYISVRKNMKNNGNKNEKKQTATS